MFVRHFKLWALLLGGVLAILLIFSAVKLFVGSCAYKNNCLSGGRAELAHTPMPTLIPATLQPLATVVSIPSESQACSVTAETLLSAWVQDGYPETKPFPFTDLNGIACEGTFTDTLSLFTSSNLWYSGALECTSCHNSTLSAASSAGLDLSSYSGVVAGSGRAPTSASGKDILGGGDWQKSVLYNQLFVQRTMPYGAPANAVAEQGPTIPAGLPVTVIQVTPTVSPTVEEPARPNTPGGPGDAINLVGDVTAGEKIFVDSCQMCHGPQGTDNVLNPGSDDGTVPALNPIDPTIANSDYKTFATNADLFIENGSRPAGVNPDRWMPPWGAKDGLTQQQIADVIAYIISLNPVQ